MFANATQLGVPLDAIGGSVVLNIGGMTDLHGQVYLEAGTFGACELAFEFSCASEGEMFVEPTTSTRIKTNPGITTTAINCSGYARVRLRVVVVTATAGTRGTLSLSARGGS